jgi:hypothetical protein
MQKKGGRCMFNVVFLSGKVEMVPKRFLSVFVKLHKKDIMCYRPC